jgi:hypothetical protein
LSLTITPSRDHRIKIWLAIDDGPDYGGDGAPLRSILVPPDDRGHRAPQVLRWHLGVRSTGLH